jgi:hypothetical protein
MDILGKIRFNPNSEKNVKPSPTKQSNFDDELSEKCDTESESSSSITNGR